MNKKLVLFDFDGTLTTKDSLWAFLFHSNSSTRVYYHLLLHTPYFILGALKIMSKGAIKEKLTGSLLKKFSKEEISSLTHSFQGKISRMLNQKVFDAFKNHLINKDEVCIVSASLDFWLMPFTEKHNCHLISTKWNFTSNQFASKNCKGKEKEIQIRLKYNLEDFDTIIAYGNSTGDNQMMELAHQKNWIK
tara:strand:- start:1706 stop:2278 length:573 start_codon:yes stop_codon:yes gene_type:complete